ncbi:ATP synthase subunit I [Wenzhouxiangella sp. AB-CW3]|uniref:ATP synthase subunit I n=1 Tax=Wenzhouxiangella sp. AB-CW3 TaxID=2771012 RepID=UPI00168B0FB2|nr:ATP synthase subunit I [Wenzhouxiangella sp. AB-CW3]QOC22678.1 ATP synthase subunit I [Wenzhouxiangella sp. AB-CW3]
MNEAQFAKTIAWLLRTQAVMTALAGVAFAMIGGLDWSMAALVGGGMGLFLTAVVALRVGLASSMEPKVMVRAFYRAMALKFVLAVIMFVIVALWFAGYFVPVVTGYAATSTAYWLAMRKMALLPSSTTDND